MRIRKSFADRLFIVCNTTIMLSLVVITLYPFWHVAMAAMSTPMDVMQSKGLILWPKTLDFAAYRTVLANPNIATGYANTLFYLVVGTTLNIVFTTILAYGLSRRGILLSGFFMKLILFTMFFSGGLIPAYMLVKPLCSACILALLPKSGLPATF